MAAARPPHEIVKPYGSGNATDQFLDLIVYFRTILEVAKEPKKRLTTIVRFLILKP